ncbi:MAG: arylformamidase [Halobacteriovoraceae bacterium]|nr:arylformamidase [Halobacteriovoraceae bacterium]
MEIWDISPSISPKTAVFPGDQPFTQNIALSFEKGNHLKLSSILTTPHIGAHADAPSHYDAKGININEVGLEPYLGNAQVIEVSIGDSSHIEPQHFSHQKILAKRVLFKTNSFKDQNKWSNDFKAVSPKTIKYLNAQGVILIGIDTPSVDQSDSKNLPGHKEFFKTNIRVLEGIDLSKVSEGTYELIALPLKLEGLDASPVRAILRR